MMRFTLILAALLLSHTASAQLVLKQSTERVVRVCGFVSVSDGITPVTSATLAGADEAEALRENTATLDISGATWAAVTGADGCYSLTLTTTATNTVGQLIVVVHDDSLFFPVERTYQVVEEEIFDACCAANAAPLTLASMFTADSGETAADAVDGSVVGELLSSQAMQNLADTAMLNCTVDTANFAGDSNDFACDLTDRTGAAVTANLADNDLAGLEVVVITGALQYEKRFVSATTDWDGANNEMRLNLSRALPATLADGVTVIIR